MPQQLHVVQGSGQSATLGSYFPESLIVRALDASNNPMVGEPLIFSVPVGAGEPSGRFDPGATTTFTTATDGNGYAFIDNLKAAVAVGTWYGLTQFVAAPGITTNWYQTNAAVGPATLSLGNGAGQVKAQNAAFSPLDAIVRDASNNTLSGIEVQFSVPAGHGTFPGGVLSATATTNVSGTASSPVFTGNSSTGAFTVTVLIPAAPSVPAATTTWTIADASVATTVQAISGGGQQAAVSTTFGNRLRSRVTNAMGAPLAGVTVTYTSPASGASCTFPAIGTLSTVGAVTDASGYADSPFPVANAIPGSYFVTATVAGATGAQFQLTNGASYLPEVCTTSAAPQGTAQVASGTVDWINTGNALTGSVGASVTIPNTLGVQTRVLLCSPAAVGALSPISDDAKVIRFVCTYDVKSTFVSPGVVLPQATVQIYNGAIPRGSSQSGGSTLNNSFQAKNQTFNLPANTTGAQVKAGNFGMGFRVNAQGNDGGTVWIRTVRLSVCYQNPDTPAISSVTVPLLICEA